MQILGVKYVTFNKNNSFFYTNIFLHLSLIYVTVICPKLTSNKEYCKKM